ncbi:MAG: acyl-CoA reductase [Bacteroidia bacterium]|nr:acyl-CoA reductase [Bacteroidia bacterium]
MILQKDLIQAFYHLSSKLDPSNQDLGDAINQTFSNNSWLTPENYWKSINHWKSSLNKENIKDFIAKYSIANNPKTIGIIMAGNIPMVGFHDLLCVLLMGHKAQIKLSSDDPYVIAYFIGVLKSINSNFKDRIIIADKLHSIDAVIATGSNNSYRYFESYFKQLPRLLRKNRKSIAVLDGTETEIQLKSLADDVFTYYGLGCRNVSQIFIPSDQSIEKVLDAMISHIDVINHHKYANNYTYHKALLLMNNEQHLDTGFLLPKKRRNLSAPLACIHYDYYNSIDIVKNFIQENKEQIQCIVGNYSTSDVVPFGKAQSPDLKDFADNINTLEFLSTLETS